MVAKGLTELHRISEELEEALTGLHIRSMEEDLADLHIHSAEEDQKDYCIYLAGGLTNDDVQWVEVQLGWGIRRKEGLMEERTGAVRGN
ncbi:hypothetical protein PHLCEN_2v9053 [Hermanssonia centrifuga]|uniref:Uncharacterized protein n=1 Tax=Hermanssonia centrifuga TaxID=98765 RepID=A0A2R6NSN7_9APHY|nr:hypothetical protein PHLCEN_2v9053 [Hermanssonia centrifuga]